MYPTLSIDDTRRLVADLLEGGTADITSSESWLGPHPEVDLTALRALAPELRDELDEFRQDGSRDKDQFEGRAAERLYLVLAHLELGVLDDPGFWRWVTLTQLWDLTSWREAGAFEKDWANYRVYVDGQRQSECVPLRMFIRGRLSHDAGDTSLAASVPQATDLWRSHIVRVRTSYSPTLTGELVREQRDHRMNTNDLRSYAKRLQRVASNVVLYTYTATDAEDLLSDLRAES